MPQPSKEWWKQAGAAHWLIEAWQAALREVLEMSGAAAPQLRSELPAAANWGSWRAPLWLRFALDAAPAASLSVGCPESSAQCLARLLASDPALPEAQCRETYVELFNQVASTVARVISSRIGRRVTFSPAQEGVEPADLDFAVQLELTSDGQTHLVGLAPDAGLIQLTTEAAQPASLPAPPAASVAAPAPRNLDMLLEVELPVSVTFGRTQLALKEVLKLASGSIVELNRLANEPVEVLVNNCVVARGEVVVVEGNYGVRVTEIVSRQDRIRSIL